MRGKKSNNGIKKAPSDTKMNTIFTVALSAGTIILFSLSVFLAFQSQNITDNKEIAEETQTPVEYQDLPLYIETESGEYINVEDVGYLKIEDGHITVGDK